VDGLGHRGELLNTDGVDDVVDQIEIVPEPAPTTGIGGTPTEPGPGDVLTTDPNITAQVKAKLLADPDVAGLRTGARVYVRLCRRLDARTFPSRSRPDAVSGLTFHWNLRLPYAM
jgi:hypothetical protein